MKVEAYFTCVRVRKRRVCCGNAFQVNAFAKVTGTSPDVIDPSPVQNQSHPAQPAASLAPKQQSNDEMEPQSGIWRKQTQRNTSHARGNHFQAGATEGDHDYASSYQLRTPTIAINNFSQKGEINKK